jgi:16S rRNA (cytosine967-C5)-methyltransferase
MGDLARHAACRALGRQARLYPEFDLAALEHTLETDGAVMSDLDRAFAHAIYDAAVRNWLSLGYLLSRCTTQKFEDLEPRARGVLMAAAAQIIILDRVPVHAAINHAVEWAKRVIRPGAGGLTNAVLRKLAPLRPGDNAARMRERYTGLRDELPAPDGSAIILAEPALPEDEFRRLSIATSHPTALLEHWLVREPIREVRRLALHGMAHPPVVVNTAHAKEPLPAALAAHGSSGHHVFSGSAASLGSLLESRRDIWVQDPASSAGVQSVADLRPSLILDLCAGQGTKTRQLAATFPNAEIFATDVDEERFKSLSELFAGSAQVKVVSPKTRDRFLGKADLVLLDVPCSNTGVLPRRPEARYRFGPETLKSLVSLQKQIIADTILLLRESPRGKILYSTCSLEPEENHEQAAWTDRWHKTGISREHRQRPEGLPGDPPTGYCDGSYAALLG